MSQAARREPRPPACAFYLPDDPSVNVGGALELVVMILLRAYTVLAVAVAGCATVPATNDSHVSARESEEYDDLAAFLPRVERARRTYSRTNPTRRDESPAEYVESEDASGRVEGSLAGRVERPLSQYLDPHSKGGHRPRLKWPSPPRKGTEALFAEFDPPVVEWPLSVREGAPAAWQARITMYDRDGVPFVYGSASRRVWLEGRETVETGGTSYADCVRLRAETDLHFGWWASFRLRETVWLAKDIGVVRRLERLGGRALLVFRFESTHEYALREHEIEASNPDVASTHRWARLAIYLDRSAPRPRVGGLAVEWATEPE